MFEEVLGHKRAKDIIEGFMKNGLPQRMIFSGPKSVGKSKIAIELAKSILKDAYKTDMLLIEKETIKIDDIRDAISFLSKRAFFGVKFLILDVNTITPEAQNAFLKALEEPYHNNYIIIIIDVPEKLFSTIRSRCVNIRFGYLSESIVAEKKLKYRSFIFEPLEALESKKMYALRKIDLLIIEAHKMKDYDKIWYLHNLRKNILRNANPEYQLYLLD